MLSYIDDLDYAGEFKEIYGAGVGLEGWFKLNLLCAFLRNGSYVTMKGIQKRCCDVIVNDVGIELRTLMDKTVYPTYLVKCMEKDHPEADCYMFLTRTMLKNNLVKYLKENNYAERHKELNSRWMLWMVKK